MQEDTNLVDWPIEAVNLWRDFASEERCFKAYDR